MLDLDKIGGSGASPRAPARGQPAAAAKPIDTAPLRSVDGSFKLAAATLISAPLRIGNADLAATLKDGVLTVSHFKGGALRRLARPLGRGQRQPAGARLSTSRAMPAASISARCCAAPSGTNQFGGSIKVTIDGRLNASGIALRGGGATSEPAQELDGGRRAT